MFRSRCHKRCLTLGSSLLKKVPQVPQVPQSEAPLLKDLESLNSPIFNDFPSFHGPITLLVTTSTARFGEMSMNLCKILILIKIKCYFYYKNCFFKVILSTNRFQDDVMIRL